MLLLFVNIAVVFAVVFYFLRSIKKSFAEQVQHIITALRDSRGKLPPGPRGLPFVGYLPFLAGKNPYTAFSDLAKDYSGIAFARLGKKNILVLREADMIREAYKMVAFSDRPNTSLKDENIIGNKGIIQAVGDVWSEHRRLIISSFRGLGLKTASSVTPQTSQVAEVMLRDVEEYLKYINQLVVGRPDGHLMLERLTGRLAGSTISSCVFGLPRFFNDEDFSHNVEIIEEGFQVGETIAPFEFLPILKKVPLWWERVQKKVRSNHCITCKYFGGLIKEKSGECDNLHQPDSLITMYRNEMEKRVNSTEPQVLSEIQLRQTMTDIFCAGTETIKYSLMWGMLYMAKHPEIQAKVQAELDSLYPKEDQLVRWDDVSRLPYTEATILEILRIRPVHSFDAEFRGCIVPKETVVLSLIWDVHLDEKYWTKPLEFQPTRFLNAEGKTFRPENFMPFGTGRRACIGDQMSMMEMFTAFSALLKRYSFTPKNGGDIKLGWKIMLSLLIPENFEVDLLLRFPGQQKVVV